MGTTPHLRLDVAVLDRNIAAMAGLAANAHLNLRPHAKTHKSPESPGSSSPPVPSGSPSPPSPRPRCSPRRAAPTCSSPTRCGSTRRRAPGCAASPARAPLLVGVDSVEAARALAAQPARRPVLVEVDCGHHRSGRAPGEAGGCAESGGAGRARRTRRVHLPRAQLLPRRAADVAAEESAALADGRRARCRARGRAAGRQRRLDAQSPAQPTPAC